jgi:hypothetical protein
MLVLLDFSRIPIACKRKLMQFTNNTKITNGILGNDHHECPFYDALDSWWHCSGNVMKHVSVSTNEIDEIMGSQKIYIDFDSGLGFRV